MNKGNLQGINEGANPGKQTASTGVNHYENFPVASFLCPPRFRPAISAIYWFARTADDLADEGDALPQARLADLAAYRLDLSACMEGGTVSQRWSGVFEGLQPVIDQFALPADLLTDLLSAFEQDVLKTRYASETELLDYCRRSANPVGRLLLHLYGIRDATALKQSDCICTALQLVNFWQDLSVDIPRGRIYLPSENWASHGVDQTQLISLQVNPATTALVTANVNWAVALMQQGAPLVKKVPGRAGWELRLVVQGGLRIAEKIKQLNFATLRQRPKINAWDGVVMAWRTLWM